MSLGKVLLGRPSQKVSVLKLILCEVKNEEKVEKPEM